jgi:branched-chain amino acid aminotransferase
MDCDQVVGLDAVERRYVEEMGGMNLFFVQGAGDNARLITPMLSGALLAGVVRDSVLTLAQDMGLPTEERLVSLRGWRDGAVNGSITETFACGTAAVVTPVGEVRTANGAWTVADGKEGPLTRRLRQALLDLHHGRVADRHGWMRQICGPEQ